MSDEFETKFAKFRKLLLQLERADYDQVEYPEDQLFYNGIFREALAELSEEIKKLIRGSAD